MVFTIFLDVLARLQKPTISFIMYVCMSVCLSTSNNPAYAGQIFHEIYTGNFY